MSLHPVPWPVFLASLVQKPGLEVRVRPQNGRTSRDTNSDVHTVVFQAGRAQPHVCTACGERLFEYLLVGVGKGPRPVFQVTMRIVEGASHR